MTNKLDKLQKMARQVETLQEEMHKQAKDALKELLEEFTKSWPAIKTVMWTQYTPYFNDGDVCNFGVNEIYFCTVEEEEFNWDEPDSAICTYEYEPKSGVSKECFEACKVLENILQGTLHDELEYVFGDHVSVIVTKDGVKVEEYEHD